MDGMAGRLASSTAPMAATMPSSGRREPVIRSRRSDRRPAPCPRQRDQRSGRGHDCEYQRLVGRAADSCRPAWQAMSRLRYPACV